MKPDYANFHDPFPNAKTVSLQDTFTAYYVMGHVSIEIPRFCQSFLNYGDAINRYLVWSSTPVVTA